MKLGSAILTELCYGEVKWYIFETSGRFGNLCRKIMVEVDYPTEESGKCSMKVLCEICVLSEGKY
jgi:hypothetical protein